MSKKEFINNIKNRWLARQEDVDMWQQFQGLSNEVSEGIYASDDHFIYELIQNAEDTETKESQHSIEFSLEDDGLVVFNNEIGFNKDQVEAICSFKKSTKVKEKNKGFIGEKGIGFKSVFKVSDQPAIFSNGYRFYFRRKDKKGMTEYIIPHWIDDEELKEYPAKFQNNTHTTLFLPFNKTKKEEKLNALRQNIRQIEPILLLFLNRLDSIKIFENDRQLINTTKSTKKNENIKVVTIKNDNEQDKYYIFKKTIDVDRSLDEVIGVDGKRKNVKQREIILAFPDAKNVTHEDRIFAFLPTSLRSRLGFIIQADFILQAGRENIAIDNDWNEWQLEEIQNYITNEIIFDFQKHSKLKLTYLNYFMRDGESDNNLINNMYDDLLIKMNEQKIILGLDQRWYKPQNILILPDDIKLDSVYLKKLYGNNYEQIDPKFNLPNELALKFNIRALSKQEIIKAIIDFFIQTDLKNLDEEVVYALTVFLSKYSSVDSRSKEYDKELYAGVKSALPIIPKYPSENKFYYAKSIYLSEEYEADFHLETIVNEQSCDFQAFNFLSPIYYNSEQKGVENFLRKILDELKEDNNKKTIEFMIKYPKYLHEYLLLRTKMHYKEIFDFLLENKKDNLERIATIALILTDKNEFYSGKDEKKVYFPTSNMEQSLNILHQDLYALSQEKKEYRELLQNIFKVKEADIHNIILDQYLPWFKNNRINRNKENDNKAIEYTTLIVKHFDEFDREQKKRIKESLYFIGSNNTERYLSSGDIYLPQFISESYFHTDSIEKLITDTSFFNFLVTQYNSIFSEAKNEDIEKFFSAFQFNMNSLVEKDLSNFLRFLSDDIVLEESVQALEIIVSSDDFNDSKNKIEYLSTIKLYSNEDTVLPANQLFIDKVNDLPLVYLNDQYRERINFLEYPKIRQYFLNPNRIEPFTKYLGTCKKLEDAISIYKYLDYASDKVAFNRREVVITPEKVKMAFEKNPIILGSDNKRYYPRDVVWTQQHSSNALFALSDIYSEELQTFFIKKVLISQHRGIKQIVDQIKDIKTKNKKKTKDYYDLLVDLSQLVGKQDDIADYRKIYKDRIDQKNYSNNIYENAKIFLAKDEKIFISDMNKGVGVDDIYFNDLPLETPSELKDSILTLDYYGNDAFEGLVKELKIQCLSNLPKEYKYMDIKRDIYIDHYREILKFAYDLLFTDHYEQYKTLPEREEELRKINDITSVFITSKIKSTLRIKNKSILLDDEKYYFNTDKNDLVLVDNKYISKAIATVLGSISDKDLKDFIKEVLEGNMTKEDYYKEEGVKEKQDFYLDISEEKGENKVKESEDDLDDVEEVVDEEPIQPETDVPTELTPEEEQEKLRKQSPLEQVKGYENDLNGTGGTTEPVANGELEAKKDDFFKKIQKKADKIRKIRKIETKPRKKRKTGTKPNPYRDGEEVTKEFFRRKDQYAGHCQVCGFTFETKKKQNYCERFTWTDSKKNHTFAEIIYPGNSLCLCGKCYSIIKGGGDFEAKFLQEYKKTERIEQFVENFKGKEIDTVPKIFEGHIDFDDMFALPIRLNNVDEHIYFTEEHLIEFFTFLNEDI